MDEFKMNIQKAVKLIDENQLCEAQRFLCAVIGEHVSSPEMHNLFGILEEYKGNYVKAAKFYRAAYAFDPSYKPAQANLERVTSFTSVRGKASIDFGREVSEGDTENPYYIEYDEFHVGRIKKKSKTE